MNARRADFPGKFRVRADEERHPARPTDRLQPRRQMRPGGQAIVSENNRRAFRQGARDEFGKRRPFMVRHKGEANGRAHARLTFERACGRC